MKRKWSLVFAAVTFALTGCGNPVDGDGAGETISTDSSALKNGTLVNSSSVWRGAVKLQIFSPNLGTYQTCSGQVVARSTIVTAAHCVAVAFESPSTKSGWVTASISRETSSGQWITVMQKRSAFGSYNPAYDGFAAHDIGIVTSPDPFTNVTSNDTIPFALDAPSGQTMWALGYGPYEVDADDGQGRSGALVPSYSSTAHEYTFRASTSQPWLCKGDSGGPLKMVNGFWRLYGVASFFETKTVSNPPPLCGSVGHWTSMLDNSAWLEGAIGYNKCFHEATYVVCW